MRNQRIKFTLIVTSGLFLFISILLALIAWYLAPILFPEATSQLSKTKSPPLTSIVLEKANFDERVSLGDLHIKTWTEPKNIKPNEETQLFLEILDSSGNPTPLDTSIHYTRIHTYAVRDDLGEDTLHLHPTETKPQSGIWKTFLTFPSSGLWHIVSQTAKDGTVHQITTSLNVEGKKPEFTPDFSREKASDKWKVKLDVSKEPAKVGEPVKFSFSILPKEGIELPKLKGDILDNGHNFILARQNDSFAWNQHGDSSVENVSVQAGIPVKRVPIEEEPLSHIVTFPKPGIWLLHFELQSKPIHFFVKVED